ncbi:hypothetical protein CWI75_00320 [Kineobactrum sediminis]|uniref:DUF2007 domain-containing protein n=2 Tax=Kineobactrum sediminis TaxID=1905677 RepID=A0A2N5Y7T8_9GAMM|nr:hypothetical protein CWI75_00320 [Kineobactrum sediminis]
MQIIYRAANIIEGHIVAGMLEAHDIESYVGGHYLQGAIGELSPLGFANVFVEDADIDRALPIIKAYEQDTRVKAEATDSDDSLLSDDLAY